MNFNFILAKAPGNWKNYQMAENAERMGKIQAHWKGNLKSCYFHMKLYKLNVDFHSRSSSLIIRVLHSYLVLKFWFNLAVCLELGVFIL